MSVLDRRAFLRTSTATAGALALGPAFWRSALAAPAVPGPGPYGPPGAPDPVTGLGVPPGFSSRVIAVGAQPVPGTTYPWHLFSDGSGTFPLPDGGWILASNSEVPGLPNGGASSITFAPDGRITGARRILGRTTMNCSGGITPWGTWLSGEETASGQIWECDPTGAKPAIARPAMGRFTHEAVCTDPVGKQCYLTEDTADGCFYRFTPTAYPDLGAGVLEAMIVDDAGRVTWGKVGDPSGRTPTRTQVPGAARFRRGEGTWYDEGVVYFVTTTQSRLYALHLREQLLELVYDGSALGLQAELTGIDNVTVHPRSGDIFVAEDENADATLDVGIVTAERQYAKFLTASGLLHEASELTGPSFDPSGTRMYIASQRAFPGLGAVYEITGPFRQQRVVAPDITAPKVAFRVLGTATTREVRRNGLPVTIQTDEDVTVSLTFRRRLSDGRRGPVLVKRTRRLAAGRQVRLRLQPTKAASDRLRGRRSVPVLVDVRATDAAGNVTKLKRNLRLR